MFEAPSAAAAAAHTHALITLFGTSSSGRGSDCGRAPAADNSSFSLHLCLRTGHVPITAQWTNSV